MITHSLVARNTFSGSLQLADIFELLRSDPAVQRLERSIECNGKINPDHIGTAPQASGRIEIAFHTFISLFINMGIYHCRSADITTQVQQNISRIFLRIRKPVEADTIGSCLLHPHFISIQKQPVITRLYNLSLMQERRFPGLFSSRRVHLARHRHHRQPGQHPAMDLREPQHFRRIIIIPASILILVSCQRRRPYHPIRLIPCDKEKIPSAGSLDIRIYPGYMIRIIIGRRKHLDLRKPYLRTGGISHLEPYPLFRDSNSISLGVPSLAIPQTLIVLPSLKCNTPPATCASMAGRSYRIILLIFTGRSQSNCIQG